MASVKSLHTEGRTLQKPLVKKVTQKKAPLGGGGGPSQSSLGCAACRARTGSTPQITALCFASLGFVHAQRCPVLLRCSERMAADKGIHMR